MRKKPSLAPLGESELELLHLVWKTGPATVSEIHQQILGSRQVAYTTVMTALRKLADKGYLTFTKEGNAYVYSTARPPDQVKHNLLSGILNKVFLGSPVELVESLVKHENLSEEELDEIRQLIAQLDNKQSPNNQDN